MHMKLVNTEHAEKAIYNKPIVIELNAATGTEGMGINMNGNLKSAIGAEGGGGMDSPS